jgi:hypothetical protein
MDEYYEELEKYRRRINTTLTTAATTVAANTSSTGIEEGKE